MDKVRTLTSEKPVVIFSKSSYCICHSIRTLFSDYGASPTVYELDHLGDAEGREIERALLQLGCKPSVPAVFIGGKLIGGAKDVMTRKLDGSLKELLIHAGFIFL
ncbi:PREDICTED: monothiol glutaredoxin-S6-like [Nelumbo nucifera]|uniref:Glutaredoxin domain-containing protein n=2 Tax=Nelumbo nucifera TaxID=4432 RepID=A0A822YLL6_NELNU|nr:PREDICTED: monothiol glutaredoxin-S6-like [Nelumbo nucifera]DAD33397.1 TPA_asm: hypothetical protein HUJ06_012249 [Nelumbo nucifera]